MITIINLKTYLNGKEVLKFAKIFEKVDKNIILGVQPTDIYRVSKNSKIKIFSQHVDFFESGRNTGFITPESIKSQGAEGTFLNHSEHRLNFDILKKSVERCKKLNLKTAIFASDLKEALKIKKLNPDYLIIEPPELVSGKISISKAKPKLIKKISNKLGRDFIVGAGIQNKGDVKKAIELGSSGIAVSSSIIKSRNPEKKLKDLIKN